MEKILTSHLGKTSIISGAGSTIQLAEVLNQLNIKKPMIVTDNHVSETTWFKEIIHPLKETCIFNEITPDPKDLEVMKGAQIYKDNDCDGIIGIGGGSSLDASKGISAIVRHEGFIMDYGRSNPNRKFFVNGREPLVLIPTTIGTGAEVSPHAVITNTEKKRKSDLQESIFYPDAVFLNPEFLMTLPKRIVKDTGIDALCHAIEVYTGKNTVYTYAPLHESIALKAIELVAANLRRAVFAGDVDMEAKTNMQWAAMLAGFALDLDAGCAHGLAGALQKKYKTMTHGESVGLLLPSIMDYNKVCNPKRFANIANAFGIDTSNLSDMEAAEQAVSAVRSLLNDIDFVKLSDYMKDETEIEDIYEDAANNSCNKNNLRTVTAEEIKQVYINALNETYE